MKINRQTVVILGMHRSGTSMTAGILKALGIFIGKRLFPPKESNPLGHFEDLDFLTMNDAILNAAGGDVINIPSIDSILAQREPFADRIKTLIAKRRPRIWGWKDPRTCLTLELYYPYLENPYFIVCHRDAISVAESLKKRNNYDIEKGLALKEAYDDRIETFFRNHPDLRRLDLEYEKALADPEGYVQAIIDFLALRITPKRRQEAIGVIQTKEQLRRSIKILKLREKIRHIPRDFGRKIRAAIKRRVSGRNSF